MPSGSNLQRTLAMNTDGAVHNLHWSEVMAAQCQAHVQQAARLRRGKARPRLMDSERSKQQRSCRGTAQCPHTQNAIQLQHIHIVCSNSPKLAGVVVVFEGK